MSLGSKIRETRESRGLTLRKLAKEVGVSPSFISQVEQAKAYPSIDSLQKIAQILSVSCSYLIGEDEQGVLQNNTVNPIKNKFDPEKLFKVSIKRMIPDNINSNLEPTLLTVEPGAYSSDDTRDNGEEFLLLLSGQLEISLNNKDYVLKEGDNIYFNSAVKHSFKNSSSQPAKVLWIKGS